MTAVRALETVRAAVVEVVRLVLVEPVREGRLRAIGWPPGLRAVAALALTSYVTAAALVLAAPVARRHGTLVVAVDGELVMPRWAVPVFLTLTVLTLALLYAASLHLAPWLRLGGLLVVGLTLTTLQVSPLDEGAAPHVVAWVGCGLLVLMTALRWRGDFRWWELPVALVVIGATVAVSLRLVAELSQPFGLDASPVALVLTMQTMSALAVPVTFVAGVAFAQLALLLVTRVGGVVDERVRPTGALAAVVAVVAAADLLLTIRHLSLPTGSGATHAAELGAAALLVVVTAGLATLVLARSRPAGSPDPALDGDLPETVASMGLPIALLVTATTIPQLLVTRLDTQLVRYSGTDHLVLGDVSDALARSDVIALTRLAVGLGLVGWAWWSRRPAPALLAAAVGTTLAVTSLRTVTGGRVELPWTAESLNDVAGTLVLVALAALAVSGRLTRARLLRLGLMLGLALAFSVRSTFGAPFVTLLGLGATAAVFLGVVWASLSDADEANGDSPRWPRPARVLLLLGNAVLAMSVLAFVQVARSGRVGLDISAFATLGDDYLGTGLLLAAYTVLGWEVVHPGRGQRWSRNLGVRPSLRASVASSKLSVSSRR